MKLNYEEIYSSVGVNRSYHCLSMNGSTMVHGASHSVAVLKTSDDNNLKMVRTLSHNGHKDIVNCVRWIDERWFVTSSLDKTVILWRDFEPTFKLEGHTQSVTSADAVLVGDDVIGNSITVASASGDSSIRVWKVDLKESKVECLQTIHFKGGSFALNVRFVTMPISGGRSLRLMLACVDNCKINVYYLDGQEYKFCHALSGHEDWAQCVEAHFDDVAKSLLIASGGQDHLIRVWRLNEKCAAENGDAAAATDEIKLKEVVIQAKDADLAVRVETILSGHEDRVTGLQFRNSKDSGLSLLSCSMDKTMIVWAATADAAGNEDDGGDHGEGACWVDKVRVGEVGGNTLGFMGCQFSQDGKQLLGYSFNGALHSWHLEDESWIPGVVSGGHFDSVEDLDWEANGLYLVSTSLDQTTRIHAPWRRRKDDNSDDEWHEIARPQVHGHDLCCLTMLPDHRMASGAEEKIVRTFEAPKIFISNFCKIAQKSETEVGFDRDLSEVAQGASVPSLGLSNKPVLYNDEESYEARAPEDQRHVKDQFPDFYFTPEVHSQPPPEETLVQNTLWPEVRKLYGHGNEMFTVTSNVDGSLIASACKASKADQAEVILWDTSSWRIVQRLPGHSLTATQMQFSPCGKFFLTVSRDRTWCLFKKEGEKNEWTLAGKTDKSTSVHQRLLWCCSWSEDSKYFATGSRDKKVAVWKAADNSAAPEAEQSTSCLGQCSLACAKPLALDSPVTALAFVPFDESSVSRVLAVGLESGKIVMVRWTPKEGAEDEWKILMTLDSNQAHHSTVKRLKVRPMKPTKSSNKTVHLASCSTDHFVKLHGFTIEQ